MHFNYDDYPGTKFFWGWWKTISMTMSDVELVFVGLFMTVLIYYLIRGNKRERLMLLSISVIMAVLVLNPWATAKIYEILGLMFGFRVFRYFWLYPIYMVLAYFATQMAYKAKGKLRMLVIWVCLVCGATVGCGQLVDGHYSTLGGMEFKPVDNIYKVSADAVDIADMIEADKKDPGKEAYVLYERDLGMEIRTYDASIIASHAGTYGTAIMDKSELSKYVVDCAWTDILASIVSTSNALGVVGTDAVRAALAGAGTDYVVINAESYNVELLDNAGLERLGISQSGKYIVYKVTDEIRQLDDGVAWNERLYSPTQLNKFGELYFINDCWQHRIIYNDNLEAPVSEWKTMTDDIKGGHTLSSDGSIYVCDDTDNNAVRVYVRNESGFELVQTIGELCNRPHCTYYDEETGLFYVLGADNGELFAFRNENNTLVQEQHITFENHISGYTRTFSIIDGYMYIVGNSIYAVDYKNGYNVIAAYSIPEEMQGTVELCKIQDYYYLTVYTDSNYRKKPAFIRTTDLSSIELGNYENIYNELEFTGTPYLMTEIDGRYYVAEVDQGNGIVEVNIQNNNLLDIRYIYNSGAANIDSIIKYYTMYIDINLNP